MFNFFLSTFGKPFKAWKPRGYLSYVVPWAVDGYTQVTPGQKGPVAVYGVRYEVVGAM